MAEKKVYYNTLRGIIEAATKYQTGEWDEKTIAEYGQTMQIRAYIPIIEKTAGIVGILTRSLYNENDTNEFKMAEIHKNLFFYGLLQQYALVDCSDESLVTFENYDLLFPLFYPFILSYCKDDYETYKDLLKDTINFTNLTNLIEVINSIDYQTLEKVTSANANMLNTFKNNKDLIDKLDHLAIMNDPTTAKVVEELKKMAVEEQLTEVK